MHNKYPVVQANEMLFGHITQHNKVIIFVFSCYTVVEEVDCL